MKLTVLGTESVHPRSKESAMYIGLGTLVFIVIIILVILLLRRR